MLKLATNIFLCSFPHLQRDVTYEEAKQFADENGKSIIICVVYYYEICIYYLYFPLMKVCCSWRLVQKRKSIHAVEEGWYIVYI